MSVKSNRIISNTAWQVGQQIYTMILSLVISAFTARYLGPANYGLIGYGASLVVLFNSVSTLGMSGVVLQRLVKNPENTGEIIGTTIFMRVLSSFLSMVLIAMLVSVLEPGNKLLWAVTMLQAVALIFNSYEMISCWFQAKLELKYVSIAIMLAATAVGIWRIILLLNNQSVQFFSASACVQSAVCAIVIAAFFIKKSRAKLSVNFHLAKEIFGQSYHFIISGIAFTVYTQTDRIMIGKMLNEEQLGIYTAAATIAALWEFVPIAIINCSNAVIFGYKEEGKTDLYENSLKLLLAGISVLGILVAMAYLPLGPLAIKILYGQAYSAAKIPLIIIAWSRPFAVLGCVQESWAIAEDKNKYLKYYAYIGCAINVVLNWFLIPRLGINGAALATLISQITAVLVAPALFKNTRNFMSLYGKSFKTLPELKDNLIDALIARVKG